MSNSSSRRLSPPQAVRIRNLVKIFPGQDQSLHVLSNFNCDIDKSEFAVILGPSGCGKSTAIRIIAGLEQPSSGSVLLNDLNVNGPSPFCGMVFQSYTSFPWLSVIENIAFGLLYSMPEANTAIRREKALHFATMVGLSDFASAPINTLSGGMKQRVAIASALATEREILLMDEPFGALDSQTRMQMQDHLLEVVSNTDKTVVFVTHDIEEAILLGDRIYVCSARPARILSEIDVPFPHPRDARIRNQRAFFQMKLEIFNLLREEFYTKKLEKAYEKLR